VAAAVAGWLGLTLGLVDVYPSLFPWQSETDRILGILICLLVAGLGARMAYLIGKNTLDWPIALITITLLIAIGLDAMISSSAAFS